MSQKKCFELLNGSEIPQWEVQKYIESFSSFERRKREYEKGKDYHEADDIHPMIIYVEAFSKLCRDKNAQVLLHAVNWSSDESLKRIFQQKVKNIEAEIKRDPQYALLRENIQTLSKEGKIQYRPGDTKASKIKKYGMFSFIVSEHSPEIDDVQLTYTESAIPELNVFFTQTTINKKIVEKLAYEVWSHIHNHEQYIDIYSEPPWVSIRTLKAYIEKYCTIENKLMLFGDKAGNIHESLDVTFGEEQSSLYDSLESERGTSRDMDLVVSITQNMKELAKNFLKQYEKYALLTCISYACKQYDVKFIVKLLNKDRNIYSQLETMRTKTQSFLLKNGLHPHCTDYDEYQVLAFVECLKAPCYESVLPDGCPRCTPVCAEEAERYPCADVI